MKNSGPIAAICLLTVLLFLVACEKDEESPPEPRYEYFPVEPGHSVTYEVDSIRHDSALRLHDTSHYFIRETIAARFKDSEGRTSYRIERYRKDSMSGDWRIADVWVANRNERRAEKVKENRRFTKMVFPIRSDRQWDGNAYNDLPEREYRYRSVHRDRTINGQPLDSTVEVLQKDVDNLIETEFAEEIYALGIGMVKKEEVDLNTYTTGEIRKGSELYMRMIDHSSP
jgi:hypothetical protein